MIVGDVETRSRILNLTAAKLVLPKDGLTDRRCRGSEIDDGG